MEKREVIELFAEQGFLLSPDFFDEEVSECGEFLRVLQEKVVSKEKPILLTKDLRFIVQHNGSLDVNWFEFERSKVLQEKGRNFRVYGMFLDLLHFKEKSDEREQLTQLLQEIKKPELVAAREPSLPEHQESTVMILKSYGEDSKKRDLQDFVAHFKYRYEFLRKILMNRPELQNILSINRLSKSSDDSREPVSVIGLVYDKQITKNGNILLQLEDVTGKISVLVTKNNRVLYETAEHVVLDEVIGINGTCKNRFIYVQHLLFPEIQNPVLKMCDDDVYAAFISDIHVGSKVFLRAAFERFIQWLNGESGSEQQKSIARKVKYLIVTGDLVDGVGVYPGQEEELSIIDVKEQYRELAVLLGSIRQDVKVIMCPGQHDAVRIAEPQPVLDVHYAQPIWDLKNVILVSNPAFINIHSSSTFEGFTILMYHGASFHYYIDNVTPLRKLKPRENPSHILKFLLQKRHLAPSHTSTTYIPYQQEDPLVIDKVPDFFVCGDMHRSDVCNYNNVTLINCSCWQQQTEFMEKTGNVPDPCKVPVVHLKTRDVKMFNFEK